MDKYDAFFPGLHVSSDDGYLDITGAEAVEVQVNHQGSVIWVHVGSKTVLRICQIRGRVVVRDERSKPDRFGTKLWKQREAEALERAVSSPRRHPLTEFGKPELSADFDRTNGRWNIRVDTKRVPWPKTKREGEALQRARKRGSIRIYDRGKFAGVVRETGKLRPSPGRSTEARPG